MTRKRYRFVVYIVVSFKIYGRMIHIACGHANLPLQVTRKFLFLTKVPECVSSFLEAVKEQKKIDVTVASSVCLSVCMLYHHQCMQCMRYYKNVRQNGSFHHCYRTDHIVLSLQVTRKFLFFTKVPEFQIFFSGSCQRKEKSTSRLHLLFYSVCLSVCLSYHRQCLQHVRKRER